MSKVLHRLPALQELYPRVQWVCWRYEERKGKRTKVPYSPQTGQRAACNHPTTWASGTLALSTWQEQPRRYDGIGYMFQRDITGIDLDHCVDEDGTIEAWARAMLTRVASYAEYSPSGTGIHILLRGTVPRGIRRAIAAHWQPHHPQAAIEMYCEGRYFTMTGKQVEGTPTTIEARQEALDLLVAEITVSPAPQKEAVADPSVVLSDEQVVSRALHAANGGKFRALFMDGVITGYASPSEAELALCTLLAFWTGKDLSRMDRLFRRSALYRDKWDEQRGTQTYGERTLEKAQAACSVVYDPQCTRRQLKHAIEQVLAQIAQQQARVGASDRVPAFHLQPGEIPTARVLDFLVENEYGDARFFAAVFAGQICYDHSEREWYLWQGHCWKRDGMSKVRQLVAGVLGTLYLKAAADLNTAQAEIALQVQQAGTAATEREALKARDKTLSSQIADLRTRARLLRTAKRMQSVLLFVQAEMGITSEQWDRDPWVLAVSNGVLDLHTGTCRAGVPEEYLRTVAPAAWTGLQTPCPRFERFLHEIFEDKADRGDLIAFLQRLLGYGITGLTTHHLFPIFYGEEGRNGKDTALDTLKNVLGPLVGAVSNDVFLAQDRHRSGGAATPHLCDLQGKRLVWGSETKEGDRLNIAQIKLLTGGGEISTRQLHGKQYAFTPTHKLVLMTNYKPHADARDKAFWARACLIDFGIRFVDQPQAAHERVADPTLKETLKQEQSGILAWLIRGCLAWQQQGLEIPPSVQLATGKYRDEEDKLLLFLQECCIVAPETQVKAGALFAAYRTWYETNTFDGKSMNGKLFGEEMCKRYPRKEIHGTRIYQGIGLLLNEDTQPTIFNHQNSGRGSVEGQTPIDIDHQTASEANSSDNAAGTGRGSRGFHQLFSRNEQETPSIGEKTWQDPLLPLPLPPTVIDQTASEARRGMVEENIRPSTDLLPANERHCCTTRWEKHRKAAHTVLATHQGAGFWWCDRCQTQQETWMHLGQQQNYPEVKITTAHVFVVKPGREQWLRFAQEAGYSLVSKAVEALQTTPSAGKKEVSNGPA